MIKALKAIESPKAAKRQAAGRPVRNKITSGTVPEVIDGQTRDKIGQAVGKSGKYCEQVEAVYDEAVKPNGSAHSERWDRLSTQWAFSRAMRLRGLFQWLRAFERLKLLKLLSVNRLERNNLPQNSAEGSPGDKVAKAVGMSHDHFEDITEKTSKWSLLRYPPIPLATPQNSAELPTMNHPIPRYPPIPIAWLISGGKPDPQNKRSILRYPPIPISGNPSHSASTG